MPKHIVVLHTDQQRFDSLTCNGNPHSQTERIDQLAAEGCNFTRHIVCNPVCTPSRASLMTGLTIPGHGVSSNGIPLWRRDNGCEDKNNKLGKKLFGVEVADKIPTIADILKEQGFNTALFGKLHLGPNLSDKSYGFYESWEAWEDEETADRAAPYYGFDTHKMILAHGEAPCEFNKGHYGRWMHKKHPDIVKQLKEDHSLKEEEKDIKRKDIFKSVVTSETHNTMWLADEVCDQLDNAKLDEQSQFIFVGFPDPHVPFTPPADIAKEFEDIDVPAMPKTSEITAEKPQYIRGLIDQFSATDTDVAQAYRYTAASVKLIDRAVGQIVDKLKALGIYDDTVIVFTSDHGDYLGDLNMLTKFDAPFHNLLHVPFIVKPTKDKSVPKEIQAPMSNADVVPTLLKMVDLDIPEHIQGVDAFDPDAMENNKPFVTCFTATGKNRSLSMYDKNFRYSYYLDTGEEELYDHDNDLHELSNLANDPEYKARCAQYQVEVFKTYVQNDSGVYNHYSLW